jgi:hypothetical protein
VGLASAHTTFIDITGPSLAAPIDIRTQAFIDSNNLPLHELTEDYSDIGFEPLNPFGAFHTQDDPDFEGQVNEADIEPARGKRKPRPAVRLN